MFLKLAFLLVLGLAAQKVYAEEPERIVGGTSANRGEFPYQVSLRVGGRHNCGGSIVTRSIIVTAAHCLHGIVSSPWSNLKVVTGALALNSGGQTHNVRNVRLHPNYKDGAKFAWANDIALIYLSQPMEFNAYQKAIPLATSEPPLKATLTLSGWGRLKAGGQSPNILQKATMYYISSQECQKALPHVTILPTHLCALNRHGVGGCQGDSGGPLVYQGRLVGIVSWSISCAIGYPDVYTRVSQYGSFLSEVRNG